MFQVFKPHVCRAAHRTRCQFLVVFVGFPQAAEAVDVVGKDNWKPSVIEAGRCGGEL